MNVDKRKLVHMFYMAYADVAELADALDLGSSGRPCRFDSCHPHQSETLRTEVFKVFCIERGKKVKANYHTHTYRCNHATGTEREYVEMAIQNGIKILGFSDHTPYFFGDDYSAYIRMRMDEMEGYITTVLDLKKEYQKDIEIHVGLEVEYFEDYFDEIYRELEQYPLEYFLLATHWYGNSHETEPYFGIYTEDEKVLAACQRGVQCVAAGHLQICGFLY